MTTRVRSRHGSARIEATATLRGLGRVLGGYERFVRRYPIPEDVRADMFIALEEIASNVVRHGAGRGASSMIATFAVSRGSFRVVIDDDGPRFNPLKAPLPDVKQPATRRRAGGLGILLVRRLTDCEYTRRRDGNRVLLRRTFSTSDSRSE